MVRLFVEPLRLCTDPVLLVYGDRTMVITVISMWMVECTCMEIVDVITMRNSLVSIVLVSAGIFHWLTGIRIFAFTSITCSS